MKLPDDNPKTAQGLRKPPLHLIPATALAHLSMALKNGAQRYGPYNWREQGITVSTYISAAERHLAAYFNGEQAAGDSGVHHLAHAMACMAILLDAEEAGKLNDDRPPALDMQALYDRLATPIEGAGDVQETEDAVLVAEPDGEADNYDHFVDRIGAIIVRCVQDAMVRIRRPRGY